ncbi:unnamed protein product [Protopolystoma xenopodis]|uniref:Uncharacterized protein n=1 Tax=Protopolystoma xenopodis TaxID=117903 RepID=A0A448XKT6_9PLAT|nr:unnamed protein product [Protopolystoma xenopodis]
MEVSTSNGLEICASHFACRQRKNSSSGPTCSVTLQPADHQTSGDNISDAPLIRMPDIDSRGDNTSGFSSSMDVVGDVYNVCRSDYFSSKKMATTISSISSATNNSSSNDSLTIGPNDDGIAEGFLIDGGILNGINNMGGVSTDRNSSVSTSNHNNNSSSSSCSSGDSRSDREKRRNRSRSTIINNERAHSDVHTTVERETDAESISHCSVTSNSGSSSGSNSTSICGSPDRQIDCPTCSVAKGFINHRTARKSNEVFIDATSPSSLPNQRPSDFREHYRLRYLFPDVHPWHRLGGWSKELRAKHSGLLETIRQEAIAASAASEYLTAPGRTVTSASIRDCSWNSKKPKKSPFLPSADGGGANASLTVEEGRIKANATSSETKADLVWTARPCSGQFRGPSSLTSVTKSVPTVVRQVKNSGFRRLSSLGTLLSGAGSTSESIHSVSAANTLLKNRQVPLKNDSASYLDNDLNTRTTTGMPGSVCGISATSFGTSADVSLPASGGNNISLEHGQHSPKKPSSLGKWIASLLTHAGEIFLMI